MKFIGIIFLIFVSASGKAFDENRRLVVTGTPGERTYESALKKLDAEKAGLRDRDVVIVTEKSKDFGIRLIGKDGGEKWKGKSDFTVKEIFDEIDVMPMRMDEVKKSRVIGR